MFKQLFGFKPDGADGSSVRDSAAHDSAGNGGSGKSSGIGSSFSSLKAAQEADRMAEQSEGNERGRRGSGGRSAPGHASGHASGNASGNASGGSGPGGYALAGNGSERRTANELQSFEEIYRNAPVKPPKVAYSSLGILRVVDMVHSPHLAGMSAEAKRNSVLMALEAVGVKVEDLLQDAMVRQRALNDYEESQETKLKDFETSKEQENALIRAELDRLSAAHLARIQENLDLVARHQDNLRAWTKRKEQESEQIAEAASFCTTQGASSGGSLTATVTRFGADAVVGKASDATAAGKR